MGTNFYFGDNEHMEYRHIGKRSSAGLFCWDCGVTLCSSSYDIWAKKEVYGDDAVHHSDGFWLDECPICGADPEPENLSNSSAGRELGFNKNTPSKKSGVKTCCSFLWAMSPQYFVELKKSNLIIHDEYNRAYTRDEFAAVLNECPIKDYRSVGVEFS